MKGVVIMEILGLVLFLCISFVFLSLSLRIEIKARNEYKLREETKKNALQDIAKCLQQMCVDK